MPGEPKFYAVKIGKEPGVYRSWPECQMQVSKFRGACFKSFKSLSEATAFMGGAVPAGLSRSPGRGNELHNPIGMFQEQQTSLYEEGSKDGASQVKRKRSKSPKLSTPLDTARNGWYRLQFDGAAKGNPGPAGAGAVLFREDTSDQVGTVCVNLPCATNNVAEYTALVQGLEAAVAIGVKNLIVQGDSKLIVEQVCKRWKVNNAGLMPLYQTAQRLKKQLEKFEISHIPRAQNSIADRLANLGVNTPGWKGLKTAEGIIETSSVLDSLASEVKPLTDYFKSSPAKRARS